jgi:hypothetical protein
VPPATGSEAHAVQEAEVFARLYPTRAARIRRLGRMPDDASFTPPSPPVLRALVTGQSQALRKLDRKAA